MAEWISVKDRLPIIGTQVLVYFAYGDIRTVWRQEKELSLFWNNVTHWMPLPEPPKEEK